MGLIIQSRLKSAGYPLFGQTTQASLYQPDENGVFEFDQRVIAVFYLSRLSVNINRQ